MNSGGRFRTKLVGPYLQDRTRQLLRRLQAESAIHIRQMIAIQGVKLGAVSGLVFGSVPPAPVAALRDQQLFVSQPPVLLRNGGGLAVSLARAQQILPGFVVLLGADP